MRFYYYSVIRSLYMCGYATITCTYSLPLWIIFTKINITYKNTVLWWYFSSITYHSTPIPSKTNTWRKYEKASLYAVYEAENAYNGASKTTPNCQSSRPLLPGLDDEWHRFGIGSDGAAPSLGACEGVLRTVK